MKYLPLRVVARALTLAALVGVAGCGDSPSEPATGARLELSLSGLRALDPATEGSYALWVEGADATPALVARFQAPPETARAWDLPVRSPARVLLTLEPPGDNDAAPSAQRLLAGAVRGARAELSLDGAVTAGPSLKAEPGHHSLFTSSNNAALGVPSLENAGIWMFTLYPRKNSHGERNVMLTPLQRGWIYEGWVVHRYGTRDAVWISYGKFRPNPRQMLASRDDTGSGPFSGDEDYRNAGIEDVPGDEWTGNPFGLEVPGGLSLPFQLNAVDAVTGEAVWTHVISIEPVWNEDEPLLSERPFVLQPYRNPIGEGGPQVPRRIELVEPFPAGTARIAP